MVLRAGKIFGVLALFCGCLLSFSGSAMGAPGDLDRSFGVNGVADVRSALGGNADTMALGPGGAILMLDVAINCNGPCFTDLSLTRFRPDGSPDRSYADGRGAALVAADLPEINSGKALAIDAEGRAVVAWRVGAEVNVARLDPRGRLDRSFGGDGRVVVSCGCDEMNPQLAIDARGRIIVEGHRDERRPDFQTGQVSYQATVALARLLPGGALDQSFGRAGLVTATFAGSGPERLVLPADGSVVVAGFLCCGSVNAPYVHRFFANGQVDRAYDAATRTSLAALHLTTETRPGRWLGALIVRPKGRLDVLGGTDSGGFALRILPRGGLDQAFGRGGVKRLRASVRAGAVDAAGRVFAIGNDRGRRWVAFRLRPDDGLDRSFGGRSWKSSELIEGWGQTVAMQRGQQPILFDQGLQGCREYCPPQPTLTRFKGGNSRRDHSAHGRGPGPDHR
jgi:uncharacterized delta-60 repeat protein